MDQQPEHPNLSFPVTEPPEEPHSPATEPVEKPLSPSLPLPPAAISPLPRFNPSRMIGIIKRKALIKDLAAVYHTECLTCCQELLELQRNYEEPVIDVKTPEDSRKETTKLPKRTKKAR